MQDHKHSIKNVVPPVKEEYPEAEKHYTLRRCDNYTCIHYDLHDPGGNNCTLLFALSEEGCQLYA